MRIFITGGLGYIGSKLVDHLYHYDNVEITILDNFSFPCQQDLAASILSKDNRVKIIRGDVYDCDNDLIKDEVLCADTVIHLAAIVGMPACNKVGSDITYRLNQLATEKLVAMLRPAQHFIYPNTNSAYGNSKEEICDENSPMNPISTYGDSKCKAELAAVKHKHHTVFRLATVFGLSPRMRLDLMVNDFTYRAKFNNILPLYEGHFRRNFVHVHDVARAMLHVMKNKYYGVFNLGNDSANMTKLELANLISEYTGCKVEEEEGTDPDQRNYLVSNQKIQQTGFKFNYPLSDGIVELLKLYETLPSNKLARDRIIKGMKNV